MKNIVLGILFALAIHGALALGLLAYFRYAPRPDTLATLDLSSVDLSFAEEDVETAAVAPSLPSEAVPPPPPIRPKAVEAPPPPDEPSKPLPPDPSAAKRVEPEEASPMMETPAPLPQKPVEAKPAAEPAPATPPVAPKQAKIDAPPRPRRTIRPEYPKGARQRGEQGEVALEIEVSARGEVLAARVVGSCGFSELDEAAVKAVRAARFVPARAGSRPVASTVRLKIAFHLKSQ